MKANGLMVGDYVYNHRNWECPIVEIHKNSAVIIARHYGEEEFFLSDLRPIPLTEEILKKNGFEYYHKNFASLSYDHQFKLKMEKWPDENGLGGLWSIANLIKIRYVHQLQHALRLCGIYKAIEL